MPQIPEHHYCLGCWQLKRILLTENMTNELIAGQYIKASEYILKYDQQTNSVFWNILEELCICYKHMPSYFNFSKYYNYIIITRGDFAVIRTNLKFGNRAFSVAGPRE